MTYGKRTLIAVDQLINTLLGGWPDETLSSRCYRWARDGVFFWQREHCKSSYESEREGRQSPLELRRVTPEA
ncbi:pseudouridine synthase [uncultured Bilophila sp.]|uniref:pseudouridine synthase n=1 Tax=uncultured Bilophila sp. TaxID=529385 RepID=UPI00280B1E1E|nr:pseudouridine synthase [uncultured Bilophila sp.]